MIKVGITGGIGSGKSLVCDVFRKLNVFVYEADSKAKSLMVTNPLIREKLILKFGESIYINNLINKELLAGIIFEEPSALAFVNSVVHPAVALDFEMWCSRHINEAYVIEEAALLFESGANKKMDKMITVYSPEELRMKRVMMRDKATAEQVKQRIKNQMPDEEKVRHSDYVVYNDEKHSLLEQIINLHNIFLSSHK